MDSSGKFYVRAHPRVEIVGSQLFEKTQSGETVNVNIDGDGMTTRQQMMTSTIIIENTDRLCAHVLGALTSAGTHTSL